MFPESMTAAWLDMTTPCGHRSGLADGPQWNPNKSIVAQPPDCVGVALNATSHRSKPRHELEPRHERWEASVKFMHTDSGFLLLPLPKWRASRVLQEPKFSGASQSGARLC